MSAAKQPMNMSGRSPSLCAMVAAGLGVVALLVGCRSEPAIDQAAVRRALSISADALSPGPRGTGPVRLQYRVANVTDGESDLWGSRNGPAASAKPSQARVGLWGRLDIYVDPRAPQERFARLSPDSLMVDPLGSGQNAATPQLQRELNRVVRFVLDDQGGVRFLQAPSNLSETALALWRATLAALQWIGPRGRKSHWQAREETPFGLAVFSYEQVSGAVSEYTLSRKRLEGYVGSVGTSNARAQSAAVQVDADVTFDFTHQGDHLLAVQGGGRTTTRMGDRRVGRTISKIDVRLLEADSIPENAWASLREGYQRESAGPKHPLFTANYARGARLQRMRARIREYPLQALLRRAESLDQASAAARTRWFLRATAHCVLEERACGRLGELFAGAAAEGAAARVTAAVLVDAATAGAHRVIARLLTDPRLSAAHKIHLLTALSAAESLAPSIATAVERLQTRADSVGRSAALLQKAHAARIETTGRIK